MILLKFVGPPDKKEMAIKALKELGFADVSDFIPWIEAFSEYTDEQLPGVCLKGARAKEDITQKELSKLMGIPQGHISDIENGKRPIEKKSAKAFGEALNIDYRVFL